MFSPFIEGEELIKKVRKYGEERGVKFSELVIGIKLIGSSWFHRISGDFPNEKFRKKFLNICLN